jgi:hypothetical protein
MGSIESGRFGEPIRLIEIPSRLFDEAPTAQVTRVADIPDELFDQTPSTQADDMAAVDVVEQHPTTVFPPAEVSRVFRFDIGGPISRRALARQKARRYRTTL